MGCGAAGSLRGETVPQPPIPGTPPFLGKSRGEIASGVRSFVVQQHVILYRVEKDSVRVLRLVHSRMDIDALMLDE